MKKNYNLILGIAVVAVVYYVWMNKKKGATTGQMTNIELATRIKAAGKYGRDVTELSSFGNDFLKAWYDAIVAGQKSFSYAGKNYNVQGGKQI